MTYPAQGKALGVDYGAKRTGLAISDELRTIAKALEPIENANSASGFKKLHDVLVDENVTVVVVGVPYSSTHENTKQAARCRSFAARIRKEYSVPVVLYDERFTSRLADKTRLITNTNTSRDSLAACHILTDWMGSKADGIQN